MNTVVINSRPNGALLDRELLNLNRRTAQLLKVQSKDKSCIYELKLKHSFEHCSNSIEQLKTHCSLTLLLSACKQAIFSPLGTHHCVGEWGDGHSIDVARRLINATLLA